MRVIVQGVVDKQSTKPTRIPVHMEFTFLWDKIESKENKSGKNGNMLDDDKCFGRK